MTARTSGKMTTGDQSAEIASALVAARKLIESPADWNHRNCAQTAISASCGECRDAAALDVFCEAIGIEGEGRGKSYRIWNWNDAPERTHAEVLAAFDRAIAKASAERSPAVSNQD